MTSLNSGEQLKYKELKDDMGRGDMAASQKLLSSLSTSERNNILHRMKEDHDSTIDDKWGVASVVGKALLPHVEIADDSAGNVTKASVKGGYLGGGGEAELYKK